MESAFENRKLPLVRTASFDGVLTTLSFLELICIRSKNFKIKQVVLKICKGKTFDSV